jgi:hypothetical protein
MAAPWQWSPRGNRTLRYALLSTVEEGLEMAGVIACAFALLLLLAARGVAITIRGHRVVL